MLRKSMLSGVMAAWAVLAPGPSSAQSDPTYPNYRIRYLADIVDGDRGMGSVSEEGVFDTEAQASEVIDILAHLVVAWRVDCACDAVRRDAIGAGNLEADLMEMLSAYGYVSRLVPSAEVGSLPGFVGVLSPYLVLNGDGFRDDVQDEERRASWWMLQARDMNTTTLDPGNPYQYARADHMGIFVDTRLAGFVQARVNQLLGGYRVDDPDSLCAFASLDRSPDDMMSWVLIRDFRRTWTENGRIQP